MEVSMKLLTAALAAFFVSNTYAADKFLTYHFNKNVVIKISNVPCPIKDMKAKYPLAVVATRIDGQHLFGCFTHEGDDIVIQWSAGDKSIFPANVFLVNADI
jgi:hypothetical protein